ncbi:MAG: cytochrome c [Deltaproteobacteria bacterium]|nr:MAG: cytochrome c [Deltaproteobacteria bacterium]
MRSLAIAILVLGPLALGACGKNSQPPPPTSGSPNAKPESGPSRPRTGGEPSQAQQMFAMVCATCHGMDGTGNGPGAVSLTPKPRNYTDAAWQASVTDEQLKETILKGGAGVGKSPVMPGQPQLADHPEVLDELVQIIRRFGKQP